jgi:hypothetical protein
VLLKPQVGSAHSGKEVTLPFRSGTVRSLLTIADRAEDIFTVNVGWRRQSPHELWLPAIRRGKIQVALSSQLNMAEYIEQLM